MNRRNFLKGFAVTTFSMGGVLAGAVIHKEVSESVGENSLFDPLSSSDKLSIGDRFTISGIDKVFTVQEII